MILKVPGAAKSGHCQQEYPSQEPYAFVQDSHQTMVGSAWSLGASAHTPDCASFIIIYHHSTQHLIYIYNIYIIIYIFMNKLSQI